MFDDHEERSLVSQEEREELPFENIVRSFSSLADHLDEQLRFTTEDPAGPAHRQRDHRQPRRGRLSCGRGGRDRPALRDDGRGGREGPGLVQAFDPPGVAARSIQECLLIQLKADPNPTRCRWRSCRITSTS
jgi:hypothetical protein